jgi:hypothetical protein
VIGIQDAAASLVGGGLASSALWVRAAQAAATPVVGSGSVRTVEPRLQHWWASRLWEKVIMGGAGSDGTGGVWRIDGQTGGPTRHNTGMASHGTVRARPV